MIQRPLGFLLDGMQRKLLTAKGDIGESKHAQPARTPQAGSEAMGRISIASHGPSIMGKRCELQALACDDSATQPYLVLNVLGFLDERQAIKAKIY